MKQHINYVNSSTGEIRPIYGLRDYMRVNEDNLDGIVGNLNNFQGKFDSIDKEIKKLKRKNKLLTVLLVSGIAYGYKKITELEESISNLKVNRYDSVYNKADKDNFID